MFIGGGNGPFGSFVFPTDPVGLTTAHILYRIADFESVLQIYVWQDYDLAPEFPEMRKFLDFWQQTLDGPLHSIRYSHKRLVGPNEWRQIDGEFKLH